MPEVPPPPPPKPPRPPIKRPRPARGRIGSGLHLQIGRALAGFDKAVNEKRLRDADVLLSAVEQLLSGLHRPPYAGS